jgi:hypothetical protein
MFPPWLSCFAITTNPHPPGVGLGVAAGARLGKSPVICAPTWSTPALTDAITRRRPTPGLQGPHGAVGQPRHRLDHSDRGCRAVHQRQYAWPPRTVSGRPSAGVGNAGDNAVAEVLLRHHQGRVDRSTPPGPKLASRSPPGSSTSTTSAPDTAPATVCHPTTTSTSWPKPYGRSRITRGTSECSTNPGD